MYKIKCTKRQYLFISLVRHSHGKRNKTLKVNVEPLCTVCPRSSDPIYIVSYYIKWENTTWTYGIESCGLFIPRS